MRLDNKAKTAKANRNKGSRTNKNDPLQHDFYNDDHHKYLMPEMNEFINEDRGDDTDEAALAKGYISIVPTQFDLTAHHAIQQLNTWGFDE